MHERGLRLRPCVRACACVAVVQAHVAAALARGAAVSSLNLHAALHLARLQGETFIYAAADFELPGFLVGLALDVVFGVDNSALIQQQPRYATNVADGRVPLSNVITDYWFRCASMRFADAAVLANLSAYAYRFDHVFSGSAVFPKFGLPAICQQAVCHAAELPFVFSEDVPSLNATFTPAEAVFAAAMTDMWAAFAKTGNPNANMTGIVVPAWQSATRLNVLLNMTSPGAESSADLCAMWDAMGYYF